MHAALTTLIDRLEGLALHRHGVIDWGSPVPSFGDVGEATVASVGLNPSNLEFVDSRGAELEGPDRRFHTLRSLNLECWTDVDSRHLDDMAESFRAYFRGNPYDRWFRKLDLVLGGAGVSFYCDANSACHLDLIPYATANKWHDLTSAQRSRLLEVCADTLGLLLRDSPVQVLVLNGRSVVQHFEELTEVAFTAKSMPEWTLPRRSGAGVSGAAFWATLRSIRGLQLGRDVVVLGYNHNLQSSFGVTNEVMVAIRNWIGARTRRVLAR